MTKKEQGMQKKKILLLAAALISIAAAAYGVNRYIEYRVNSAVETEKQRQAETESLKEDALEVLKTLDDLTVSETERRLLSDFAGLDKKVCTDIIDTYIYGTYNAAMQYVLNDEETNELAFATPGGAHTPDLSKVADEDIRDKFTALKENEHILVYLVNGSMFADVDYGYFVEKYGQYLSDDYLALLKIYRDEKNEDYFDENNVMNTTAITDRLDRLYGMMTEYPDSDVLESMQSTYSFYKSIYLGAFAQSYVYEDGSIKKEVFDSYVDYASRCKDQDLSAMLTKLCEDYAESSYVRTVPIYETIKAYCLN